MRRQAVDDSGMNGVKTHEPPDGDFASYVERLSVQPTRRQQFQTGTSSQAVPAPARPPVAVAAKAAPPAAAVAPNIAPQAALAQVLAAFGVLLMVAAMLLFALGFATQHGKGQYVLAAVIFFAGNAMRKQGASMRKST